MELTVLMRPDHNLEHGQHIHCRDLIFCDSIPVVRMSSSEARPAIHNGEQDSLVPLKLKGGVVPINALFSRSVLALNLQIMTGLPGTQIRIQPACRAIGCRGEN